MNDIEKEGMWRRAARETARAGHVVHAMRRLSSIDSSFCHHETTHGAVTTLRDAFWGPPFSNFAQRPVYQTMTTSGDSLLRPKPVDAAGLDDPDLRVRDLHDNEVLRRILTSIIRLRVLDETFKAAQRQGKLSFYLESYGVGIQAIPQPLAHPSALPLTRGSRSPACQEETAIVSSAAALEPKDDIFSQYREHGALLWRGASFEALAHQCCGSREDPAKGRQMPVHYGDRARNFHTVSSPLATQILHAVGFSYAKRLELGERARKDAQSIVACYFGDGTSSEGDFHAGLNFAATLQCPVVFICRNNGYAISTPTTEQYSGDGIASRAEGYGITSCRVDGGDARAVYSATREARRQALDTGRPILLELMTHRLGDHSTSDDRRNYVRQCRLIQAEREGDPIRRLASFLGVEDDEKTAIRDAALAEARHAIDAAHRTPRPDPATMFEDIYDPLSVSQSYELVRQRQELLDYAGRSST
jgi:2-oxoisovalerate dehydrogenase E1 component alpha subunit